MAGIIAIGLSDEPLVIRYHERRLLIDDESRFSSKFG